MTYMPAKPRERLSQRRLVYELRIAIDRARNAQTAADHATATKEVDALIRDNPTSTQSGYVLHNIGTSRREWLAPRLRHTAA
jgi:hypothetical protein